MQSKPTKTPRKQRVLVMMWRNRDPCTPSLGVSTVQLQCKTVRMFLKKLKVELPYDPVTPLLGIYSKGLKAEVCMLKFTAVLFTTP